VENIVFVIMGFTGTLISVVFLIMLGVYLSKRKKGTKKVSGEVASNSSLLGEPNLWFALVGWLIANLVVRLVFPEFWEVWMNQGLQFVAGIHLAALAVIITAVYFKDEKNKPVVKRVYWLIAVVVMASVLFKLTSHWGWWDDDPPPPPTASAPASTTPQFGMMTGVPEALGNIGGKMLDMVGNNDPCKDFVQKRQNDDAEVVRGEKEIRISAKCVKEVYVDTREGMVEVERPDGFRFRDYLNKKEEELPEVDLNKFNTDPMYIIRSVTDSARLRLTVTWH